MRPDCWWCRSQQQIQLQQQIQPRQQIQQQQQLSVNAPTFWPRPGVYPDTTTVTLNDDTYGAAIFYTIDGSNPTPASTRYTGPITIAATTTIRAITVASNVSASEQAVGTYEIR